MRPISDWFGRITTPQGKRSAGLLVALAVVVGFSAVLLLAGSQRGGTSATRIADGSATETPSDTPTATGGDLTVTPTGIVVTPTATDTSAGSGETPTTTPPSTPTPHAATPTDAPPTATPSATPVLPAITLPVLQEKQFTYQCVNGTIYVQWWDFVGFSGSDLPFSVTIHWNTTIDGHTAHLPAGDVTVTPAEGTFTITRGFDGYNWTEVVQVPSSDYNNHVFGAQVVVTAINGYQLVTPLASPVATYTPTC